MNPVRAARLADDLSPSGDETKFQDLLDSLSQTVFEFDLGGRFVYVNRTGLQTFGYTREEVARGLSVLDMVAPSDRERLHANMRMRFTGGVPEGFQYLAMRKDGSTFPTLVHTTVVMKDGRPAGLQGFLVDISGRVSIELALHRRVAFEKLIMDVSTGLVANLRPGELNARIDQALAEIGRFLAVDRSYVFLFSPDGALMDNTHEWAAAGIALEHAHLQRIPVASAFPWFIEQLRQYHVVPVPRRRSAPGSGGRTGGVRAPGHPVAHQRGHGSRQSPGRISRAGRGQSATRVV